jgi:hypothetical protein
MHPLTWSFYALLYSLLGGWPEPQVMDIPHWGER